MVKGLSLQRLFWQVVPADSTIAVYLHVSFKVKFQVLPCAEFQTENEVTALQRWLSQQHAW